METQFPIQKKKKPTSLLEILSILMSLEMIPIEEVTTVQGLRFKHPNIWLVLRNTKVNIIFKKINSTWLIIYWVENYKN